MKRTLLSIALALALCLSLAAPALAAQSDGSGRGSLTFTVTVAPQYEAAGHFSDSGLAPVKANGKWGYIDTQGNTVIDFQYDLACVFHEGLAVVATVRADTRYSVGFVDTQGSYRPLMDSRNGGPLVIPLYSAGDWDPVSCLFCGGYLCLGEGNDAAIYGPDGYPVSLPKGYLPCSWPVTEGIAILRSNDDARRYYDLSEGRFLSLPAQPQGTLGMDLRPFHQGLAPVAVATSAPSGTGENAACLWGFVDRSGNWVIQPQYTDFFASDVNTSYQVFGSLGLAMVCKDGKFGAIDRTGKTVIPFQYDELWPVSEGRMVYLEKGNYGYLNASDRSVAIRPQFQQASSFLNGLAAIYNGQQAELIDSTGARVPGGDSLDPSAYFTVEEDGSCTVYQPGEYVILQKDGRYGYGHIQYLPALPEPEEMDSWAYKEVTEAIQTGLIPASLQNLYRQNITRGEFCELIVRLLEEVLCGDIGQIAAEHTGCSLAELQQAAPFLDTSDSSIVAANALGIVSGYGNGEFGPHDPISRQQAAVMLCNAARFLGMDTEKVPDAGFRDVGSLASWSREAVNFVAAKSIMNGVGNNSFNASAAYSREQSFMTILRLFRAVQANGNAG